MRIADLEQLRVARQRFADYLRLLSISGARETETLKQRWANVRWGQRKFHFSGGRKGGTKRGGGSRQAAKPRDIDFFDKLEAHLKDMYERRDPSPQCETWRFPADHALGLAKKAAASPYVQEISDLLVTKMPPEQAVAVGWHWVYMATVFRLDHRGETAGQRSVISQRGYVATRLGLEALMAQLYREAIQRGLGQAQQILIIADGAVWIWNLAKDRFPQARQQLDLWHAEEHLWAVAHDLYGRGMPEARTWVEPLLQQVRDDQTTPVIATLAELKPRLQEAQQKKLQTQIEYFEHNTHRMKYKEIIAARQAVEAGTATPKQIQLANQPLGSGAIESTCRQYQCRFKRTGQFWTTAGDEALMCLETFWRNGRWHELYPHAKSNLALN